MAKKHSTKDKKAKKTEKAEKNQKENSAQENHASPKEFSQDEKFSQLEQEVKTVNDKYLRLYSEFDNYRKRTIKEKTDLYKYASEEVIVDLLPILDDFERAIQSEKKSDNKHILQGLELIYNKLFQNLKKHGLEAIESNDKKFDTDEHEAITKIPAQEKDQTGMIIDTTEKGYKLNGKVIRFAKVVVAS